MNNYLDIEKRIDEKISNTVLIYFVILMTQFILRTLTGYREGTISNIIKIISILIQGAIYLSTLKYILERSGRLIFYTYIPFLSIYLLNLLVFEKNVEYLYRMFVPFFMMSLPTFIYTMSINDLDVFYKVMFKISSILVIYAYIFLLFTFLGLNKETTYTSGLSYYLLFPLIVEFDSYSRGKKIINFINTFSVLFLLLLLGARGPLLCFFVYIILKIIKIPKNAKFKELVLRFILIVTIVILIMKLKDILSFIYYIGFEYFNIKSRTIYLLINDITHLSGRDSIYITVFKETLNNPIIGLGLVGDRALMRDFGLYSHNIFLELISNFGIFIGIALSSLIIYLIISVLFLSDEDDYSLSVVWISIGFVTYLFSGSIITGINFWIMLAVILKINYKNRRRIINGQTR